MGVGANYVLDKGFLATGATAYAFGELVVQAGTGKSIARSGANGDVIGICQEDLDTGRLATGKAVIDVRLLGIARVIAGAPVAVGDRLVANGSARAVPQAQAAAGAQPVEVFGRALTAAAADGDQFDVLLTPGATY